MTQEPTPESRKDARNRFWGRVMIIAMGLLALAQVVPMIWRWFTT